MSLGNKVGSVVGAGGKNIQAIQDATGVRCEIECGSLNDAVLHIIGQPAAVQEARRLVEALAAAPLLPAPSQVGRQVRQAGRQAVQVTADPILIGASYMARM